MISFKTAKRVISMLYFIQDKKDRYNFEWDVGFGKKLLYCKEHMCKNIPYKMNNCKMAKKLFLLLCFVEIIKDRYLLMLALEKLIIL